MFVFINRAFADPLAGANPALLVDTLRWALSFLVISYPVFLLTQRRVRRAWNRDPELRSSRIRKWLTYMTLFVAAGVVSGDTIVLVYYALGGELAWSFVLKVAIVAAIAASVFGYYLWDLRQDEVDTAAADGSRLPVAFAGASSVAVVAALVAGVVVTGSPESARDRGLDIRRIYDLQQLAHGVDIYWDLNGGLPESLDTLSSARAVAVRSIVDPESGEPYAYRATGEKAYELCATFDLEAPTDSVSMPYRERFWRHRAGYHCFDLEAIEPETRGF